MQRGAEDIGDDETEAGDAEKHYQKHEEVADLGKHDGPSTTEMRHRLA